MLKTAHVALVLSLLLPLAPSAAASTPHASFSHGFSSHAASAAHAAPSAARSSGFGTFSRSSSTSSAASGAEAAARPASGGFGSFGGGAAPKQSDSALSQQLSKDASQAKALQTLDQRRAAQQAQNAPQTAPAPNYAQPAGAAQPAQAPTTVIVNQNNGGGGIGHVIAGAMIARSMSAHAHSGYYSAPYNNGGAVQGNGGSGSGGFWQLFMTLFLLAVIAWGVWFAWKGVQRRRAAARDADKPNYSFKRN